MRAICPDAYVVDRGCMIFEKSEQSMLNWLWMRVADEYTKNERACPETDKEL